MEFANCRLPTANLFKGGWERVRRLIPFKPLASVREILGVLCAFLSACSG